MRGLKIIAGFIFLIFGSFIYLKFRSDTLLIFKEYDKNSVAADAKFEDKIVVVSGTIQSIGKDIMDTAYLVIGGSGFLDGVQCMLPRGQEGLVARVSKGQYVTLKGKVSGQIMGNVIVNNCSFSN